MAMTEQDLKAALDSVRHRMLNEDSGWLSQLRKDNFNRYLGELYGHEKPGYSRYTTREVFEAIEWALPNLLRTFTGGDRIVVFEPVGPEDESQAEQETDVVNHYLLQENAGFITFYEWFKDALLYPNGYAKIWTEEVETVFTENYTGLTEFQLQQIDSDPHNEITAASSYEKVLETPEGLIPAACYDVTVKVTRKEPKLRFQAVPPEEVGVDPETTSICLDEARFICHRSKKTKSWLIEAGYDKALLEDVSPDSEGDDWNNEITNRHGNSAEFNESDEFLDESTELYTLEEWYVLVDFDGDGIAERRKVDVIGGEVFENIEQDYQPFVALACIPVPHRHDGISLGEVVKPIQELSTFYQRAINDNIARINRPRKIVSEQSITDDGLTIEQLQDINSDIIIVRGDPSGIMPEQHQPVIQELIMAHQGVKDQVQMRTGVSPGIALDANVLQKATEGAYSQAMNSASQLMEMIARIFAETGVRELMIKAHKQIKMHQDQAKVIKIRGQWVETNPQDWRDRTNVTVNVGLGFSDKAQQMDAAKTLLDVQTGLKERGLGFASDQNIMNALEDFVEAVGRKNADRYFTLPPPPPPPQPDPMVVAQVNLANAQAQKISQEAQMAQAEFQSKEQRENAKAQAEIGYKQAQAYKTIEEGKKVDLEIDAVVNGMNVQEHSLGALSQLAQQIQAMGEFVRMQNEGMTQNMANMQSALAGIQKPRMVIRDESGNIIGTKVSE